MVNMDLYEQQIREVLATSGDNFIRLFGVLLEAVEHVGFALAMAYLEKSITANYESWLDSHLSSIQRTEDPIEDALEIFYKEFLGFTIPEDGCIVEQTETRLVTRWWCHCPIYEACKHFNLDTREVCLMAMQRPDEVFLSRIDSRLRFNRNYDNIRPHAPFCEEIITLETDDV